MTDSNGANGRDRKGRFAKGHAGGPGNPRLKHLSGLQAAVREAITPADLQALLGKLQEQALEGDVHAARTLLDRVCGRPRIEESAAAAITLPSVETAGGCSEALARILKAAAEGEIDRETATQLAGLVELSRKSLETVILEERIAKLEERSAKR